MLEAFTIIPSPVGELTLVADACGLTAVVWRGETCTANAARDDRHPILVMAGEQLDAYFAGTRTSFDLPLSPRGTAFQRLVWGALATIPFGETRSYRDIAVQIGQPSATRAVGAANGRNPLSIVVPCHRVIGADGSLTGFGGGVAAKRWLLAHESRQRAFL